MELSQSPFFSLSNKFNERHFAMKFDIQNIYLFNNMCNKNVIAIQKITQLRNKHSQIVKTDFFAIKRIR